MNRDQLKNIGVTALKEARLTHNRLGAGGEDPIIKNQHGETSLKVDIECEKAVISILKKNNIPCKIFSEEHGVIVTNPNFEYTVMLDGLDGSAVYKKARGKGRYGTMLAIYFGQDPKYSDYIFCGVAELAAGKIHYALKNQGSFLLAGEDTLPLKCNSTPLLSKKMKIYIDKYFDINKKTFSRKLSGFNTIYSGSSCIYYVDVASGQADLALECTRKGNLEIAVAYGLVKESGGVMITLDGETIHNQKFLLFGQDRHIPIITASNLGLANDLLRYL